MTAQVSDRVRYRGEDHALAGHAGRGLFDPAAHGLKPVMASTACWRGFQCTYLVEDGGPLLLDRLDVRTVEPAPPVEGVAPQAVDDIMFSARYEGLNLPIQFTGGLVLGRDFLRELYVHAGFHPAWKYREVHELIFRDGVLVTADDRSDAVAEFREWIAPKRYGEVDEAELADRLNRCFRNRYPV